MWSTNEAALLNRTIDALERVLRYMQGAVSAINLDGVFCVRRVAEQLQAFLKFEPQVFQGIRFQLEHLLAMARQCADEAMLFVQQEYTVYSLAVGFLMTNGTKLLWYPSQNIPRSMIEKPISCKDYNFNLTINDLCLSELGGPRYRNSNPCDLSDECLKEKTKPNQRGYELTHQVLYWEMLEIWGCQDHIPKSLRDKLCANVLRDAEFTEKTNFPEHEHDLFMEQIGLCGFWGYKDFHKQKWLEKVLEWQKPTGCYTGDVEYMCVDEMPIEDHIRVKREEKTLTDGCLSHKTGVAMLALVVNIRFEAEKEYFLKNS
ncbi:UPF0764 protein C16orf89 homolog [Caerostris darwini]|uniref:UPF0764 protein C16orf89 homolog n=1 Tax=Caerostris darwini TaxID=1538125 RepID=A0AAV4MTY4_9ARAC|nr:UPF0764 protein C16orf89 homolog [Caerostris darwini]